MKFHESGSVFPFSWEQVAQALWQRYPNPESNHVLSEDTLERKLVGHTLLTKRFLIKTNRLPKWGEKFTSAKRVGIIEESIIDPVNKEIKTYTRNVGLSKVMSCIEKVTYLPSQENPMFTVVSRQAWVDSSIFGFGFAIQIEYQLKYCMPKECVIEFFGYSETTSFCTHSLSLLKFGLDRYRKNVQKANRGFECVLKKLFHSTIPEPSLPVEHSCTLEERKQRLKEVALRARDIAQAKARPVYAKCETASS